MPFDVLAVSNYFLDQAEREGRSLTHMQLQKLVYIAHGWHLAITGGPLIYERVEAWPYGPVIPDLYHQLKQFGSGPVSERAMTVDLEDWVPVPYSLERDGVSPETVDILDHVWREYGRYSGIELSSLTHQPGTPWDRLSRQSADGPARGRVIPDDMIRKYYVDLVAERRGQRVG
jgi:uncharacterized phage-associated protein